MKHFLVTRFNLRSPVWNYSLDYEKVLTPVWHKHRFEIFLKFCYPSVVNQSNQNFSWLVFFDLQTPKEYHPVIYKISNEYPNFIPIYCKSIDEQKDILIDQIKERTQNKQEFIITTRFDNDDILHQDFIHTIQGAFKKRMPGVVDIKKGYQLKIEESHNRLYFVSFKGNPFISLGEYRSKLQTILNKMHHDWSLDNKVITIKNKRLWIQLIHKKNLSNIIPPRFFQTTKIEFEKFGIQEIELENPVARKKWINHSSVIIHIINFFFIRVKSKLKHYIAQFKEAYFHKFF